MIYKLFYIKVYKFEKCLNFDVNVFLDRGVLVGTQTDPHFGFFSKFLKTGDFSEYKNADKKDAKPEPKQTLVLTSGDGVDCQELSY